MGQTLGNISGDFIKKRLWNLDPGESGLARILQSEEISPGEFLRLPLEQLLTRASLGKSAEMVQVEILLFSKVFPERIISDLAFRAAREVLFLYENMFPEDRRPHDALDISQAWFQNNTSQAELERALTSFGEARAESAQNFQILFTDANTIPPNLPELKITHEVIEAAFWAIATSTDISAIQGREKNTYYAIRAAQNALALEAGGNPGDETADFSAGTFRGQLYAYICNLIDELQERE